MNYFETLLGIADRTQQHADILQAKFHSEFLERVKVVEGRLHRKGIAKKLSDTFRIKCHKNEFFIAVICHDV